MSETESFANDDQSLRLKVLLYYAIMVGAFAIGLYGFIDLILLAGARAQNIGLASLP